MVDTIYEKGDDLHSLAKKAKEWFDSNNVPVPTGAKHWQKCAVTRKEIPPGTGVTSLRRYGFNITEFISSITGSTKQAHNYNPIDASSICDLGLLWVSCETVNGHKKILTKCTKCTHEEVLDYGTLQRMKQRNDKYCRYCREVGGKRKELGVYDIFTGFSAIRHSTSSRIVYSCNTCESEIERSMAHIHTSEYLVCEKCFPNRNFGVRHYTDLGYFDSKIEYEAYKILLQFLKPSEIIRQKKYDELFNTGTKHTADFYIPSLPLVLEVTSRYNKLGSKYKDTAMWKLSLSPSVKFAYSLKEVEDIVRPLMKVSGSNVENCRSLLRRCPIR